MHNIIVKKFWISKKNMCIKVCVISWWGGNTMLPWCNFNRCWNILTEKGSVSRGRNWSFDLIKKSNFIQTAEFQDLREFLSTVDPINYIPCESLISNAKSHCCGFEPKLFEKKKVITIFKLNPQALIILQRNIHTLWVLISLHNYAQRRLLVMAIACRVRAQEESFPRGGGERDAAYVYFVIHGSSERERAT